MPDSLAGQEGALIYFSLGSLGSADVPLMRRVIGCLAATPHRYIVSKGPLHAELELAPNMYGAEFLPQTSVIPQADLVITHGGNNTTTECLHFGKPMIVLPLFWDQHDNAQRVDELGLGVRLDTYRFTDAEMHGAIARLLGDEALRARLGEAARQIQARQGLRRAADLIEASGRLTDAHRARGQEPLLDRGKHQVPGERAEPGRAVLDQCDLVQHLVGGDRVLLPGAAAELVVGQHRLQPVQRPGEPGLRGAPLLELRPQRPEFGRLRAGQQPEQPLGRGPLGRLLPGLGARPGVNEQVARVDFDQVVDQHHAGGPAQVRTGRRIFLQNEDHQGQMPRVLGGVLPAAAIEDVALPEHRLEPVGLPQEAKLTVQGLHVPHSISRLRVLSREISRRSAESGRMTGRWAGSPHPPARRSSLRRAIMSLGDPTMIRGTGSSGPPWPGSLLARAGHPATIVRRLGWRCSGMVTSDSLS